MREVLLSYQGYDATVRLDVKSGVLRGRVEGTSAELVFETADVGELEARFHAVMDDYLAQYHGVFTVRMDAAMHGRMPTASR